MQKKKKIGKGKEKKRINVELNALFMQLHYHGIEKNRNPMTTNYDE